jgi:hypothetical protein
MTSARGTQRLAALLAERTNVAPDEAVELIGALDRSPIAIGRLATQLEQVSGWPSEVAGGALVHDLEEILRARGINIPVRACVACGETGPMTYTGPVGASCKRCGPQGEQLCPAGRHSIKIGARCVACRDEDDIATLAAAVRSVGVTEAAASEPVRVVRRL